MSRDLWAYETWPSRAGQGWGQAAQGTNSWDQIDFHLDLGCGKLPKARIGVDRYPAPGVAIVADLDSVDAWGPRVYGMATEPGQDGGWYDEHGWAHLRQPDPDKEPYAYAPGAEWRTVSLRGLPFADSSIKSIISHHFFEHVGAGFIPLVEEIYRILEPGGVLRAITPLFPSWSAVSDPDHKRYFMADGEHSTWDSFCGTPDNCWLESFSVPYSTARFEKVDQDFTPAPALPHLRWGVHDARELRVALKAVK